MQPEGYGVRASLNVVEQKTENAGSDSCLQGLCPLSLLVAAWACVLLHTSSFLFPINIKRTGIAPTIQMLFPGYKARPPPGP